ncbi:hypothetical protein Moror_202 [Moniliophthora roreri MCA 2997]|uniref:SAGA-associated factor 11 n=1 Tax=Moniliophthora roreri (strain MCA 2997) TaxID=1381753 RepID=V2XXG2_MONRO|nr:hypothetical protein Moror_202 [Moniliophthora roreri MCA 2997]
MPTKAEKAEKEEVLSALTTRIFCAMLDDIVMDAALQAHNEISRSRAICETCKTRCHAVHVPGPSKPPTASSRAGTPSLNESKPANGTPGTPGSTTTKDGTILLECMHCQRPIASNRFAPHLEKCLGLSSSRRTTNRGTVKSKQASDTGRSNSPASEAGFLSDDNDSKSSKGKMKSKAKRTEEAEFNLKRKRQVSPQVSPNKSKKPKASGSPLGRPPKAESPFPSVLGSQSKIPSKLRDSSTAPHLDGASSSSSRSSSPDGATPLAATLSPTFKSKAPNGQMVVKRPSPPRPPPPVAFLHGHDDEGDETGSSTDTDSG